MATKQAKRQESTARAQEKYVPLGIDEHGAHHVWISTTDQLYAVHPTDGIHHIRLLEGKSLDEYMEAVDNCIGWHRRDYGVGLVEVLARSMESA